MTNKITDLENQPQQPKQHTSSIIEDLAQLQTLSEEEMAGVVGGGLLGRLRELLCERDPACDPFEPPPN